MVLNIRLPRGLTTKLGCSLRVKRNYSSAQAGLKKLTIGLIPGDGIGCEVIPAARLVLDSMPSKYNLKFFYHDLVAGFENFQKTGTALPEDTVQALRNCDGGLFGAVSSPSHKVEGYSSPIVALRKKLDLYANVRPVVSASQLKENEKKIDILIIRENTECLYIKDEEISVDSSGQKVAIARRRITENASRRCGDMAFRMALGRQATRGKNFNAKVTIVHKANVLSITDGLWRETIREVYNNNPEYHKVAMEEQLVDSMVYRLFREPHVFDVVVAPNLYGDILSDGAAALVGSLGVVPSANVGDNFVMGEPVHGSAPDIVGQDKANPIAAIRSASLLLAHLGHTQAANCIDQAVDRLLVETKTITPDMGGKATTLQVTEKIISFLN